MPARTCKQILKWLKSFCPAPWEKGWSSCEDSRGKRRSREEKRSRFLLASPIALMMAATRTEMENIRRRTTTRRRVPMILMVERTRTTMLRRQMTLKTRSSPVQVPVPVQAETVEMAVFQLALSLWPSTMTSGTSPRWRARSQRRRFRTASC